jgi:hypothetical protein
MSSIGSLHPQIDSAQTAIAEYIVTEKNRPGNPNVPPRPA